MGKKPVTYDEFDRSEEAPPKSDALIRLVELAHLVLNAKVAVEEYEELLSSAKARLRELEEHELPDAMASIGMPEFRLDDGTKITVRDTVYGSLPKEAEAREKAIAWVEENDGAELIKTDVNARFGKSQHNEALDLAGRLKDMGYDVSTDHGIHPQSLAAWARELLRDGRDVNFELLGLTAGQKAVITIPKEKKGK